MYSARVNRDALGPKGKGSPLPRPEFDISKSDSDCLVELNNRPDA
jgi:hypothetical protein